MFPAIKWRPELELGVDMMDRHHREMIGLCGVVAEKSGTGKGGSSGSDVFLALVRCTAMHFSAEEELMRRYHYPGRSDHQDRHHELTLLLQSWEHRARQGTLRLNASFLRHLGEWVENHILGSDQGLSKFLLRRESEDPTRPTSVETLPRQTPVLFKPLAGDRLAQPQPGRGFFHGAVARIKHF